MQEPTTQVRGLDTSGVHSRRGGAQVAGPDNLPDLLLIERARSGEEGAIEALIRRYSRRLFRVARSVLPDEDAAEFVVQEAYLAAFGDLNRYTPIGKFAAWLTRLAFSQARSLRASGRSGQLAAPRQVPAAALQTPASTAADEAQERRELEHAIGSLPDVFRTVFVLRVVEGISGIETAASLGVHETTVRTRMYRAQRRLAPDMVRRVRVAPAFLELTPERLDRIVKRVLAQLPHGSMLTISTSPP
ncbi:MAG TPA: sigma-70 family RNA polymerase sigma factor [Steroidobacteraceae bacterium]